MAPRQPKWIARVEREWKIPARLVAPGSRRERLLKRGLAIAAEAALREKSRSTRRLDPLAELALPEQPLDSLLLEASRLYRRSRELYFDQGGAFFPRLVSSARTLSSAILVENAIEYSPVESELVWRATDPVESRRADSLGELRRFVGSVYHEQNHRILWKVLPSCPRETEAARRYLNFAEALVIASDMALADELGPTLARLFHWSGVTYDPGTTVLGELGPRQARVYRNYLHACAHATYLHLEGYSRAAVDGLVRPQQQTLAHSGHAEYLDRALARAANLNAGFLAKTNLAWQRKHLKTAIARLASPKRPALTLPEDPSALYETYIVAEAWFATLFQTGGTSALSGLRA